LRSQVIANPACTLLFRSLVHLFLCMYVVILWWLSDLPQVCMGFRVLFADYQHGDTTK
jgi:hypothetical protein